MSLLSNSVELKKLKNSRHNLLNKQLQAWGYLQTVYEIYCNKIEFDRVNQEFQTKLANSKSKKFIRGYKTRSIAIQAGVLNKYLDQVLIKKLPNGITHIFFGGIGKPAGPKHGHYVINYDNKVVYRREPFAAHGKHNFVKD